MDESPDPPELIESEDEGLEDAFTLEVKNVDRSPEPEQKTDDKLADNADEGKGTADKFQEEQTAITKRVDEVRRHWKWSKKSTRNHRSKTKIGSLRNSRASSIFPSGVVRKMWMWQV